MTNKRSGTINSAKEFFGVSGKTEIEDGLVGSFIGNSRSVRCSECSDCILLFSHHVLCSEAKNDG